MSEEPSLPVIRWPAPSNGVCILPPGGSSSAADYLSGTYVSPTTAFYYGAPKPTEHPSMLEFLGIMFVTIGIAAVLFSLVWAVSTTVNVFQDIRTRLRRIESDVLAIKEHDNPRD